MTDRVAEDERGILEFVIPFLKNRGQVFADMIEVGSGPTIHHLIPFVPFVEKATVADYVAGNLEEIRKWVRGTADAHDWSNYLGGILRGMYNLSESETAQRVSELKAKIQNYATCDIFNPNPLGTEQQFDLVTSFYCVECSAPSREAWNMGMKNLFSLVRPGGWVILSALRNTTAYHVGTTEFPTIPIHEPDVRDALLRAGAVEDSILSEKKSSQEWKDEGFHSIVVACAQKPHQPT